MSPTEIYIFFLEGTADVPAGGRATGPFSYLTADVLLGALQRLLPPGLAFTRDPDARKSSALGVLADMFALFSSAAGDLSEREMDPRETAALLPDWEGAYGLPDPCVPGVETSEERHLALVAKLTGTGGQSVPYFISVAAALGYSITITQFTPYVFGRPFGELWYGDAWRFAWQVNGPTFTVRRFEFGIGVCGDPFTSTDNDPLQCVFARLAPAHTTVLFDFSG